MNVQEVVTLFDYDRWATDRQVAVIEKLSAEQYAKDLGSSYGGIRGTLVHIFAAELLWYARWNGDSPTTIITEADIPTLPMLRDRWSALRFEMDRFTSNLTDEKLAETLAYKDLQGNPYVQPLSHLIRHVINHSTYHRGQITTMMRQLGATPPRSIDLIAYYRETDHRP